MSALGASRSQAASAPRLQLVSKLEHRKKPSDMASWYKLHCAPTPIPVSSRRPRKEINVSRPQFRKMPSEKCGNPAEMLNEETSAKAGSLCKSKAKLFQKFYTYYWRFGKHYSEQMWIQRWQLCVATFANKHQTCQPQSFVQTTT